MIKKILYTWLLLIISTFISTGQSIPDQPPMPVMFKVTVDPETGYDSIIWNPVNDPLVDYYAVCYSKITNPAYPFVLSEPIAYVNPDTTFYVNKDTESGQYSLGYSVLAVHLRDDGNPVQSVYDYPDSTIFLSAEFDSCQAEVKLSWNPYNKWKGNIESYKIYQVISGHEPAVVAIIAFEEITSHTLRYIPENMLIGYFVETLHTDGIRTSKSNLATIYTGMLKIPDYVVGSNVNPNGSREVLLNFIVDEQSELSEYQLWRSTSIDGIYELIKTFDSPENNLSLNDNIDHTSAVYYYKLTALNKCSEIIRTSNIINNIMLTGTNNGVVNQLSWNAIEDWPGETDRYVLYRRIDDSGQTDSILLNTNPSYSDDVSSYFSNNYSYSGVFCYQVKAIERNNPYTLNSTAYSNEYCISVTPEIKIPNAFIPNNPAGENSVFRPVFLFEPLLYELIIFNRWGNKIWEGSGPWDGRSGSNFVSEGVYLYQLTVIYPDNTYKKSGHVTILYR